MSSKLVDHVSPDEDVHDLELEGDDDDEVDGDEDNVDGDVEEQECFEKVASEITPFVGLTFKCLKEAAEFVSVYALACGFDTRKSTQKKLRDYTVKSKVFVCNRQGSMTPRKVAVTELGGNEEVVVSPKRVTKSFRTGCKARIRVALKGILYVVTHFHEGHNHELFSAQDREFQKLSRKLSPYHKEIIVCNSRLSIGATKTYKMCKEHVKGFMNLGAGLNDFKNFNRDVKCFIHGRDGQLFIDRFKNMAKSRDGFYFDYDVDEHNNLTRAIWADAVARQSFTLYGDAVSYDPTYKTNMYSMVFTPFTGVDNHKCSVTFCGALIAKEDHESFEWVFSRFKIAMGGKEPEYLITDQDPGIIKAFPLVFSKAKHRFCMWHIMNKVPVKYGGSREDYLTFRKKLNKIVWDEEIEGNEFDSRWDQILEEHDTSCNADWFKEMFKDRKQQWVMAYWRDVKMGGVMRTTQRSESENSFFKRFESKSGTLVEFWMRFESAMDQQRHTQKRLDNQSRHSDHQKVSETEIEAHAGKVYTHEILRVFQEEIKDSTRSCVVCGFDVEEGWDVTTIKDSIVDRVFVVRFHPGTMQAMCTCNMFERLGVLCRHILWIYTGRGIKRIPDKYVAKRWTKDVVRLNEGLQLVDEKQTEMTILWSEVHKAVGILRGRTKEDVTRLSGLIKDFRMEISPVGEHLNKQQELESLLGCEPIDEITIHPPKQSKNKGGGKRLVSSRSKAISKSKKQRRRCANCKKKTTHDKRNCPDPFATSPPSDEDESERSEDALGVDEDL